MTTDDWQLTIDNGWPGDDDDDDNDDVNVSQSIMSVWLWSWWFVDDSSMTDDSVIDIVMGWLEFADWLIGWLIRWSVDRPNGS